MGENEKLKFGELFDKLTLHKNHFSDDYLETLIYFLEIKAIKYHVEMYKYKIYFMIVNRLKICDIIKNMRGDKLKNSMEDLIEDEEVFKPLNEIFKTTFGLQKLENRNNKNNLFSNKINFSSENVKIEKIEEINEKKEKENINSNNIPLNNIIRQENNLINYEVQFRQNFPDNQNERKESSLSNISSGCSEASSKTIEEIKNKIDMIISTISADLPKFVKESLQDNIKQKPIELFSTYAFFLDSTKIRMLPIDYKLKFLTVYAKVFLIFTEKQKLKMIEKIKSEILSDSYFDESSQELIINLLFDTFKFKNPKDFLVNLLKKAVKDTKPDDLLKQMENVKNLLDLSDLFYLFTINKVYFFYDELTYHKLLFLLFLYLTQNPKFNDEHCYDFLYNLFIIHKFFGGRQNFDEDFLELEANTRQVVFKKYNFINLKRTKMIDSKIFFSKSEIIFCKRILEVIKKFFSFDKKNSLTSLLKPRNFKFTMNIVELFLRKENCIYTVQNIPKFRNNLIKLEHKLYQTYAEFANLKPDTVNYKYDTGMYQVQNEAFIEVEGKLRIWIKKPEFNVMRLTLYPFGSITQFLGNKESDLDIYMHLDGGDKDKKIHFLRYISKCFESENKFSKTISKRLITITYYDRKGVKIDLNYFGVCSVLNSAVLRVYSQCDERFVILAHNIKNVIKSLNLNNTDVYKVYLNSFCWMTLLVTFLQDIVYPPVLPKILKNSNKEIRKIEAALFENKKKDANDKKKNYHKKNQKTFEEVVNSTGLREYVVNDKFSNEYSQIYESFVNNLDTKNQMGLSELFIKFLEFVIFYFKYDSVFVHSSFAGECFMSKSDIKDLENSDKHYYDMANLFLKKEKAEIIIRDPFDHGYNPAQTMFKDKTIEFNLKLKEYYFNLIETGELIKK